MKFNYSGLKYHFLALVVDFLVFIILFGDEVLDLGCGSGELIYFLQEKGYNAIGVDVFQAMVKRLGKMM